MQTTSTEKYFLVVLLSITIILTLIILFPFLAIFVLAIAFAVVLNPIFLWIKKHLVGNIAWLASLLTVIIFLLGLCVPLFFIGKSVFNQTQNIYINIINSGDSANHFIENINSSIDKLLPAGFNFDVHSKITELISSLSGNLANFFSATLKSIFMFTLMILTLFFLFKDGEQWKKGFIKIFPLSDKNINLIFINLEKSVNQILKGSFLIAISQAFLAWFGFTVFGVPNAILWAVVTGLSSFVPTIGTSVVTLPAILFLFFTGMHIQALGLLVWSLLIIGTIDNILNPYIISRNSEIPSLFILFAILGGISLMGPLGILIGPLVLSLLYSLISIYKKELKN